MVYTTNSAEETERLAAELAAKLDAGDFVALRGDLGAGKTAFARGLARGLGVRRTVLSPSFTLMRMYTEGRLPLYHFDMYRLSGPEDLAEIGFDEYAEGDGVCVAEWAERAGAALPQRYLDIYIEGSADLPRRITVSEAGEG
ncbi:MAG: tRNA (adenosine(37)-N6)-threonylcarbamoyltransferase complex ATPase subunit type 1 TsaE [Clostridia bacterium]|nr:tRNA (adenosine(37)-N6)-threonylcarbamoyltransferase complex ATPase subunit type 1 TsaE [Clostridia bacterium]